MKNVQLEKLLNEELAISSIKDYCPNGLQVEGKQEVIKIVTGVTASQALIDKAIEKKADALLVHHGYFWKGEPEPLVGMKGNRIRTLIKNNINLYAYHLPLDIHPTMGNNAELARLFSIKNVEGLEASPQSIAMKGQFEDAISAMKLEAMIEKVLSRKPLYISSEKRQLINSVAWCSGGGQDYIELAASQGIDAFISGEISERTTHAARELGIHYYAAGHHATERYGVKALGEWLAKQHGFDVEFIDIDNPA